MQRSTVNSVSLTAAQRLSVLVTAKNDTRLNYNMHADMNTDMFDKVPPELQPSKSSFVNLKVASNTKSDSFF